MDEDKIEEGIPVTMEDEFWLNKMRDITAESIKSVEEAGKQVHIALAFQLSDL